MAKQEIKEVAIHHFYKLGYEGVKMSKVAEDSGIKKQSLSYHYHTKKELFEELYKDVIDCEIHFTQNFFEEHSHLPPKEKLYYFLKEIINRSYDKLNTRFLQSLSYSAPTEIDNYVSIQYVSYLNTLKTEAKKIFNQENYKFTPDDCTIAFVVLYDGLIVDLLYSQEQSFNYTLDIAFKVFWNSIQN